MCRLRNIIVDGIDIKINNTSIEVLYDTKFVGVHIDFQLSWNKQIDYTCKILFKCVAIIFKVRKGPYKPSLIMLYYSFAYPIFMYCNHVTGDDYPTNLEKKLVLVQTKLVRIITNSPFRAHSEPLLCANRLLIVNDMNMLLECLCINGLMKISKSSRTSTSTSEIVMYILYEMMTLMFCMEDSMYDDLV